MNRLFIVGVGRSGTSLLHSMVAAHPLVAMLPETGFLRRYCATRRARVVTPETVNALRETDERLQRIPEECWRAAVSHANTGIAADVSASSGADISGAFSVRLYRALLETAAPCIAATTTSAVRLVGDKDPRLVEYLPLVAALFPDAYVAHIVRDARDVLVSKMNAAWSQERDWRLNAAASRIHFDAGESWGRRLFGERYYRVQYETLIRKPEETLAALARWCGLEYDAEMLGFSDAAARLGGGKTEEWKRETLGPLLTANTGKWRDALTERQIAVTEGICAPWFSRVGYDSETRRPVITVLYRFGLLLASPLYRFGRAVQLFLARRRLER